MEAEKDQHKLEKTKLEAQKTATRAEQLSSLIRGMFREVLADVEKLRASAGPRGKAKGALENKFYAASLDILGLGVDDINDFIEPRQMQPNADLVQLVEQLNQLVETSEPAAGVETTLEAYKRLLQEKSELERRAQSARDTLLGTTMSTQGDLKVPSSLEGTAKLAPPPSAITN